MARIRAAVLGVHDEGAELCAAVAGDRSFRLIAVADDDIARAADAARRFGAEAYDDCRLAIVSCDAEALFVTLPVYRRLEYLKLAASRGLAVLATDPPAMTLEEAAELARVFADAKGGMSVVRFWQSEPAYVRLGAIEMLAGRVFAAHADVLAPPGDLQGWRGDLERAGGGVLLHDTYDALDALRAVMGMPEEVSAVLPRTCDTGEIRTHDTEDAATLMLRFSGPRVATVVCRRAAAKRDWRLCLHATRATVVITPERMAVEGVGPPSVSVVRTRHRFAPAVAAFAAALETGLGRAHSPIAEHLPTMAVIQAAYLSARTGQPESPRRVYRMATGEEVA